MQKKTDIAASIILLMCGLGYLLAAFQYPMGKPASPGPGVLPRLLGLILSGLSLSLLAAVWKRTGSTAKESTSQEEETTGLAGPLKLIGVLICYTILMEPAGFIISTFLALFFFSRFLGLEGWVKPIILSVCTVTFAYLLFVVALGVPLPSGTLWGE